MKNFDLTKLLLCAGIVLALIVGRCSAPKPEPDHHTADSLKRVIAFKQLQIGMYRENARKALQRADQSKASKVVVKIKYVQDTAQNHAMRPTQKDSTIKELLKVPYSDSSRFTEPVANGVLDLNSRVGFLTTAAVLDSSTISAQSEGIKSIELALEQSGLESSTKDNLLTESKKETERARKEMRKQRRLKLIAFSIAAVIGTLNILR